MWLCPMWAWVYIKQPKWMKAQYKNWREPNDEIQGDYAAKSIQGKQNKKNFKQAEETSFFFFPNERGENMYVNNWE